MGGQGTLGKKTLRAEKERRRAALQPGILEGRVGRSRIDLEAVARGHSGKLQRPHGRSILDVVEDQKELAPKGARCHSVGSEAGR